MLGVDGGAGFLAAVPPEAVVYGSGESLVVLTRVTPPPLPVRCYLPYHHPEHPLFGFSGTYLASVSYQPVISAWPSFCLD